MALLLGVLGFPSSAPAAPELESIGSFDDPIYVTAPPRDRQRLFVVERAGRVRLLKRGQLLSKPFLDIRADVDTRGEGGLISIAFPPNYRASGRFYVFYTDSVGIRVAEFRRSRKTPNRAKPSSRRILLTLPHSDARYHYAGQLQYGPDRRLYISIGDGGPQEDPNQRAQDLGSLWGKILRIDPRASRSAAYRVPADNPFNGTPGARPEIWSFGLRNPWRFSFDRVSGALTIGDVGYSTTEEVDFAPPSTRRGAGANFGWSCFEGLQSTPFGGCSPAEVVRPVLEIPHSTGACAVMGGYVVRDRSLPSLWGRYVYGDWCSGSLRSARLDLPTATGDSATGLSVPPYTLVSFGQDARRRVYAVSSSGPVYRLQEGP